MPQRIEYPHVSGKRWEWHLVLIKEWLRTVEPGIGERKYAKWLRTRKVFERKFILFMEHLLGLEREARDVVAGEVGEELLEALKQSEEAALKAQEAQAAQATQALERGPGRDMPRPRPGGGPTAQAGGRAARPAPPSPTGRNPPRKEPPKARDDDEEAPDGVEPDRDDAAPVLGPPAPETDPFMKALLERFTELNPYLSMFVLKEIGDSFLSPVEVMKRIGASGFEGVRPNMQQLEGWILWLEWLGGLKKIGFRHKTSTAAREIAAYLTEMPLEDLLNRDDEPEPEPEPEPAAPVVAATPTPAPARRDDDDHDGDDDGDDNRSSAAGAEDEGDADGDLSDDELDDEDLDLPPTTEPQVGADLYWKRESAGAKESGSSALAELTRSLAALDPVKQADEVDAADETVETSPLPARAPARPITLGPAPAPVASAPAAAPAPAPAPAPVPAGASAPVVAPAPAPAPVASAPVAAAPAAGAAARAEAVRLAMGWWLDEPPGPSFAQSAGIKLAPHPSGKPVGLFKVIVLAGLLEAGPVADALALFQALDAAGTLEAYLVEGAPLERVLDAAATHGASPALEQRLVHLQRWRKGLLALPFKMLSPSQPARTLASTLREAVTGPTLGAGLLVVVRELARGGWRLSGADAIEWVPFP